MILFSRTRAINLERAQDALAHVVDIGQHVSQVTGLEVSAWTARYGSPIGTVSWTTIVEGLATLGEADEKLAVDPGFQERLTASAGLFEGPMEDNVAEIVATAGAADARGDVVGLVTAQCAPGKIGEAMAWGVEILNEASGINGLAGAMFTGLYGEFGTIGWYSLAGSLAEVDAARAATNASSTYIEHIDAAGGLFLPGTARGVLVQRLL